MIGGVLIQQQPGDQEHDRSTGAKRGGHHDGDQPHFRLTPGDQFLAFIILRGERF